jgi:hypothetical protein
VVEYVLLGVVVVVVVVALEPKLASPAEDPVVALEPKLASLGEDPVVAPAPRGNDVVSWFISYPFG